MIQHIVYFKLKPSVTPEKLDEMIIETRIRLLKIQGVTNLKVGKNVDEKSPWQFFLSLDLESMERLELYRDDPIHIKYVEQIIKPNTDDRMAQDFDIGARK
ncbi:Dabb family protein [Kamptonema cortianum]|nr:Dabb family protein [Oscillatoria laete-virens]MDK3157907.1 Dabb family protein [Kamptonema cortianum]MDL5046037.1 Dabb family protein [Oscillatoria amoena NRMC-F 0135]MDL5052745.1 Dabb family protein [Oscillatoria laete-virens NRMC-F 0139]